MARLDPMALIGVVHLTWKRRFQSQMTCHGITLKHYYVLRQLRRREFLCPSQIADMLFCDRPTASVAIDTMEKHGWVRREPDLVNRKWVRVILTPAGLGKLTEVETAHRGAPKHDPLACLDASERETLAGFLRRIRAHLDTLDDAGETNDGRRG